MPTHNLSLDAEAGILIVVAAAASLALEGRLLSNMFITSAVMSLFFLLGVHSKFTHPSYLSEHRSAVFMSFLSGCLIVPAASYLIYNHTGIDVFLALAVAGPATGSARIWSNMSSGDGELAGKISTLGTVAALLALPITLYEVSQSIVVRNAFIGLAAFSIGFAARKYKPEYGEDLREHFTRLSLWLILVVGLAQMRLSYESGVFLPETVSTGLLWFCVLAVISIISSGITSLMLEHQPRKIANYFVSGFRNIEVTLLAAAMLGGEAILLTVVYYIFRQCLGFASVEAFNRVENPKLSVKSVVKQYKHGRK